MKINNHLRVLLIGANIWYFGEGMLGPLYALFAQKIGGDVLEISWAWSAYLIVAGLMYVVVGSIADKYKNKEIIMIAGYFLNALFTFGYLFVTNVWQLFIVQAGLGLAVALATPTWYALFSKYTVEKHDGFQWGSVRRQ